MKRSEKCISNNTNPIAGGEEAAAYKDNER